MRRGNANLGKSAKAPRTDGVNAALSGAFYNDSDPAVFLQKEKPYHRRVVEMSLEGFTNKEIAERFEVSVQTVQNILRQPFNRERMIEETKKSVAEEMKAFLEAQVMPNLQTLVLIRDKDTAKDADRKAAADSLLDRILGKPTQPITQENKDVQSLSNAELAEEVKRTLAGISTASGN